MNPVEVVAGPLEVYVAPVGTAFPAVNAAPAGTWFKLGTTGTKNYDEAGVTVSQEQTLNKWRAAGTTGPRKVFRTEEDLTISFTLVDLTPEQYAKVINDAAVTTQAGPPAVKRFPLLRGLSVATFAFFARGTSPVLETVKAQYQVPIVYEGGSPAPVYVKGAPAGLAIQFCALEDTAAGFGEYVAQTA